MKSTAVYRALRDIFAAWCKANGFRRTRGAMLGWYKPAGDGYIAFWFQCSRSGYDQWAGSKFVVELQHSDTTEIYTGRRRDRIGQLLDQITRARVLAVQNEIIARLPRPPANHFALQHAQSADWFLGLFEPEERYSEQHDLWFRYHDEDDVKRWGQFLLAHLPDAIERFSLTL